MTKGLQHWIERIRDREMPIFGRTVDDVQRITQNESASASTLAHAILQDAAMTARILKLANSVYFNAGLPQVSTISRAIVVLGFDSVRDLAISVALIDRLLTGGVRQRVQGEMARSFHAAVQARAAAEKRGDTAAEEVFIATLLLHLGDMAFWCFGAEQATALDAALRQPGVDAPHMEQAMLGFNLKQLSAGLAREWRLSPLLQNILEGKARQHGPQSREAGIELCCRLAHAVELGWESAQARAAVAEYAGFVGLPLPQVLPMIQANAEVAAHMAESYGADAAARMIPVPAAAASVLQADAARRAMVNETCTPDPLLQLAILREVSALIHSGGSLYDLLDLVLEGMYRGVGMDRVLVALVAPDKPLIAGRVALGDGSERLVKRFHFSLGEGSKDALTQVLEGESLWLRGTGAAPQRPLRTSP